MILQWVLFFAVTVLAYIGISVFAQLSGGSSASVGQAFLSIFRPIPFAIIIFANMVFAIGVYYGLVLTRYAIPTMLAIGALTSFVYSLLFLGANVTATKIVGIVLVVAGIVLLGL